MSSTRVQESKSNLSRVASDSTLAPVISPEYQRHYLSIILDMEKSFCDIILFDSHVLLLIPLIPEDLHEIISVEVLTVLLLSKFPKLLRLYEHLTYHSNELTQYLTYFSASSKKNLKILTKNLICSTKQAIQDMIGQNLKPSQVFILLTCIELFQNIKKIPINVLIAAVNNCSLHSELITNTSSLPSIYSLISSIEAPYLPVCQLKEFSLVLDLDETLGHYSMGKFLLRPGVQNFLSEMNRYFELILFTAATREYADWAMQIIDPEGIVMFRLYKEHTLDSQIKDLAGLGRNLDRIIIIDNIAKSFEKQPRNGIQISTWTGDQNDRELENLIQPLIQIYLDKGNNMYALLSVINNKLQL